MSIRVARGRPDTGYSMRITIRPIADPRREIDLTSRLVSAIAEELWRLYGGNDQVNWLEAEHHLRRIVGDGRTAVRPAGPDAASKHAEPAACPGCPKRVRKDHSRPAGKALGVRATLGRGTAASAAHR